MPTVFCCAVFLHEDSDNMNQAVGNLARGFCVLWRVRRWAFRGAAFCESVTESFWLTQELKDSPPILLLTFWSIPLPAGKGVGDGVSSFLAKPWIAGVAISHHEAPNDEPEY